MPKTVNQRVRAALDAGLHVILCVGELEAQREYGGCRFYNLGKIRGLQRCAADQPAVYIRLIRRSDTPILVQAGWSTRS